MAGCSLIFQPPQPIELAMSVPIGTKIELAPSGWYFRAKLRIGFSYFRRYALNATLLLAADLVGLVLAFELAAYSRLFLQGSA